MKSLKKWFCVPLIYYKLLSAYIVIFYSSITPIIKGKDSMIKIQEFNYFVKE